MFPALIHLGPLHFTLYGAMAALGVLVALVLANRDNQRIKLLTPRTFERVVLSMLLWGLISARLLFVAANLDRFIADPGSILAVWQGGLVFYGGPLGAAAYLAYHFLVARRDGCGPRVSLRDGWTRLRRFFDLGAPYLALAHAFGRLGCLAAGCCYGAPHDGMFALHYPDATRAFLVGGGGRYPVPLIESGLEFSLFLWLSQLCLRKRFDGQVMLHYVLIYTAARFVLEMFRGDAVRGYVARLDTPGLNEALGLDPAVPIVLTTSQFISLTLAALAIALLLLGDRSARSDRARIPMD